MLTDNLIAYWKLDESSGNAEDIHSTYDLTNGGTSGVTYEAGKINNGARFQNSYPTNNDSFSGAISNLADFSISLWVNSSSTTNADNGLFTCGSWNASGDLMFMIRKSASDVKLYLQPYGGNPDVECIATLALFDGNWHHIVATYSATANDIIIYVDNSVAYTKTDYTSLPTINFSSATAYMGTWKLGSNYRGMVDGMIDEVGLWSRVLSSGEVSSLYNSGNALAYPFTTGSTNYSKFLLLGVS